MKWQKKLTKKELRHIRETTTTGTLRDFKVNIKHQRKMKAQCPNASEPCWECHFIAKKLGI